MSYPYFFLSFFFVFFFHRYFPWQTLTIHIKRRERGFPLPPANEHSYNSSRFLPFIFTQSLCSYQTDSWWDFFSLEICILFAFLWMQLSRSFWLWHFKVTLWGFEFISTINFLLQNQGLNKLRFTPLATTVYLSHLPNPTPSHNLSSNCFPKCTRNKGWEKRLQEIWKKDNKKQFPSAEIGNNTLIYISIKRVFQIDIDYTRCYKTLKNLNTTEHDS